MTNNAVAAHPTAAGALNGVVVTVESVAKALGGVQSAGPRCSATSPSSVPRPWPIERPHRHLGRSRPSTRLGPSAGPLRLAGPCAVRTVYVHVQALGPSLGAPLFAAAIAAWPLSDGWPGGASLAFACFALLVALHAAGGACLTRRIDAPLGGGELL